MGTDQHCDRLLVCGVSIQAGTWGQTDTVTGGQCVGSAYRPGHGDRPTL